MRRFLAGILATTLMLETAVVPVAMALEPEDATSLEAISEQTLGEARTFVPDELEYTGELDEMTPWDTSMMEEAEEVEAITGFGTVSGTCGENLTWELVESTGVLTIRGSGEMEEFSSYSTVPWYDYRGNVRSVVMGNSVTSIGDYGFYSCENLISVNIPSSVVSIGQAAFYSCSSLTSVVIPEGVTAIGSSAFSDCDMLEKVVIPSTAVTFLEPPNTGTFDSPKLKTVGTDSSCNIVISWTNSIPDNAFHNCTNLTSVNIPSSVTSLGDNAFSYCDSLISVDMPDLITNIDYSAFNGCISLTSINIPDSVTSLGGGAFSLCQSLTKVIIPSSVTQLNGGTFINCTSLTSVSIPDSITSIGDWEFYLCQNLNMITIPDSVTSIGYDAFSLCHNLTDVYYSGSKTQWEDIVMESGNSNLTNATIHYNSTGPKITLSAENLALVVGKSSTLSVIEDTLGKGVNWYTDNPKVAKVSNGKVTAVGEGETTIRAVSKTDKNFYVECTVSVKRALTDLDLWGLSKLVYADVTAAGLEASERTVLGYINHAEPDLDEHTAMLYDYYAEELSEFRIITTMSDTSCGFYATAFEAPSGEVVIAYRGSVGFWDSFLSDEWFRDWSLTNMAAAFDVNIPAQYKIALEFYEILANNSSYSDREIILTGHSLGGGLATFTSVLSGAKAVTFNGAGGYILEDVFYHYPDQIDSFNGLSNWDFKGYYNEDDTGPIPFVDDVMGVGVWNADIYPTYGMDPNNLSDTSAHDLESMVRVTNGQISALSASKANNSYNGSVWSRMYGLKGFVFLANPMFYFKNYSASNTPAYQYIFYSTGNYTLEGNTLNSDVFVLKDGDKAYGKGGDDQYIIHETGKFTINIEDSSGDDVIYFSQFSLSDLTVTENNSYYIITTKTGGQVSANTLKWVNKADMTIKDKNGETKTLSAMAGAKTMSVSDEEFFSLTEVTGTNLVISVVDDNEQVLGTYTSDMDAVSANEFAFVYPTENGLEFEVMNQGKYLRIEEGTNISATFYPMNEDSDRVMQEFSVELTGHQSAIINTYAEEGVENFYYLDSDNSVTAISTTDFVKMTNLSSSVSTIDQKTGENSTFTLTTSPSNIAFEDVAFSWKSMTEDPENATSIASVTQEEDGSYTLQGIAEGTDTLVITSLDGSDLTQEISVTITQDAAPTVTMTSNGSTYTNGWSGEDVTVSGTKSGYETIYVQSGEATNVAPVVSHDGKTTVSVYGYNATTGAYTATTSVEIWMDTKAPEITGVDENAVYYLPKIVDIRDTNFKSATINGTEITIDEYFSGKYVSEIGSHTVVAQDESGKSTSVSFEIKALPVATLENADLIAEIRDDFETRYYDFPESTQVSLDAQIRSLEDALATLNDPDNSDNDILLFRVNGQIGYSTIDTTNKTVTFTLESSELSSAHLPTLDIPKGATISNNASQAQKFSAGVTYTITAIDGSVATWTVTAVAPENDGVEAVLERYTVTNNVIMLEFDSRLSNSLLGGADEVKLVHSTDPSLEQSVVSVTASGSALFIEFETSLHDVESGVYNLTIPEGAFQTVGTTANQSISIPVEITNVKTQSDLGDVEPEAPNLAYTVTFNPNGGTVSTTTSTTNSTTGTLATLPTPTKTGYTFDGWYDAQTGGNKITTSTVFTKDTTIYAQFTMNEETKGGIFTITFYDISEGDTPYTALTEEDGTLSCLPVMEWSDYIFVGWFDAPTGGTQMFDHTVYTKDTTLYAQWTKEDASEPTPTTYTVTFNPNGGTVSTTTSTTNSTTGTLASLPTPTKTGYTFDGWYDSQTGGNKITTSTVFTKDTTIYAQWAAIETDTTTEVGIKLNSVDVSENGALVVNYSYKGQLTNYGISVATSEEDAINRKGYAQGLGESKIVTGLWVTETYNCTISFLAYPDPSQTLYVAVYGVDTEGNELISSVLTLQREVSATDYVISFDSAGGSAIPSQTTDTDGALTSLFTPIRTGYTFNGWFTTTTGGTKITTSTVFNKNTTVYAQWTSDTDETTKEAPFTVTFSPMGGTVSDSTKDTSTSGKLSSLPTATRENYEFQGWYTLSAGGTVISTSTVFTEDVTVFAQWKRVLEDEDDGDTDSGDVEEEITDNTSIFSGLGTSSTNGTAVFSKNTPKTSEKVYMNVTLPSSHAIDSITMFDESGNLVKFYRDMSSDAYYFYQPSSFVTVDITTRNLGLYPYTSSYSDVPSSEWYEQYIRYITDKGVMTSSTNTFSPETDTNRGTIAQALLELSKESALAHGSNTTSFKDLSSSDYWNAVTWCTSRGIMSGYDSNTFAPNDLLTREQFATALSTFAKTMGLPNTATTYQLDRFHDTSEISLWATSSVAWCVENGLLAGFDGYLKPQDTLSRAELSTMLSTFHKKFLA